MNSLIIDLCCGLGRFPGENTVSIDIDRKVKPTIVADIEFLPLRPKLRPKLCHASPPCKYLSFARAGKYGYNEKGIAETFRLIAYCFDAFAYLEPRMWTLEHPRGFLRRFLRPSASTEYVAYDLKHKKTDFFSNKRSLKRSIIPLDIRQKLLENAEEG